MAEQIPAYALRSKTALLKFAAAEGLELPDDISEDSFTRVIRGAVEEALGARAIPALAEETGEPTDDTLSSPPEDTTEAPESLSDPEPSADFDPVNALLGVEPEKPVTASQIVSETIDEAPELPVPEQAKTPASGAEKRFSVASLKPVALLVLGVPSQAVTGAQSAGRLPGDDEVVTIEQAKRAVTEYMNTEVSR